jgi:glycyl-tRNA synthetase
MAAKIDMAKFAKFCKETGFIFQSSEIYGGLNGFWDYGPLGVELKKNIKDAWWQDMVRNPPPGPDGQEIRMVGLDCSIIMNPQVWVASGHVATFADPTRKCSGCGKFTRADQLWPILAECEWMNSLIQEFTPLSGKIDTPRLMKWAKGKGQKLAPNLALVRNPEVTISFLSTRVNGQPEAPPDLQEMVRYFATEQLHQTGLQEPCPACGAPLGEAKQVSLMFESHAGLEKTEESKVYLRPETAQGIFANYRNVLNSTRLKLPFGIAQIGKAFRNEVTPRNYTFRSREFEQMEIEFFCRPSESMKWYEFWRDLRKKWYSTLGIQSENLRPKEQSPEERAFYSIGTTDIEYMFPFSDEPQELEGVAHRAEYDLTQHAKHSGKADDMSYFDEELWNNDSQTMATRSFKEWLKSNPTAEEIAKYKFTPHVIEPSAGADRFTLAVLCEAYHEDKITDAKGNLEERIVMRFHPRLAPFKAAIFPLVNKDGMPEKAMKLYRELKAHFNVFYDDKGAVGRRYRRQDEIGTPFCITVDGETMAKDIVTIRYRDEIGADGKPVQKSIPIAEVKTEIWKALATG